jgi:Flp pilus assembly pilin Flp
MRGGFLGFDVLAMTGLVWPLRGDARDDDEVDRLDRSWRTKSIEYALMAGLAALAAAAVVPGITTSISTIFSQVTSVLTAAASQS